MNTYMIHFRGRRINALGVMDLWGIKVEAETLERAILKLYESFEHISVISIDNVGITEWEYA